MENFLDFEDSNIFKLSSIALGIFNIFYFFSHVSLLNKLNQNKDKIDNIKPDTSFLSILFQLISSSLFFGLLCKLYIKNTKFLTISYLIGIVTSLEWFIIYIYYSNEGKIINILLYMLLPIIIIVPILLIFLLVDDFNKNAELALKNIAFIFYVVMFISPGINIYKLIKTGNPKYIMVLNSIIGAFTNITMILFIIALNYYDIIELYYIIYGIVSLIICILEIIFYYYKILKGGYSSYDDFDNVNPSLGDYAKDNETKHKKISLVNRNSIEDE